MKALACGSVLTSESVLALRYGGVRGWRSGGRWVKTAAVERASYRPP